MRFTSKLLISLSFVGFFASSTALVASEGSSDAFSIEMKNGAFNPPVLTIPASKKTKLHITNRESAEVEVESYELNIERKIQPNESIDIYISDRPAGEYPLFDDNNPSAKGKVIIK